MKGSMLRVWFRLRMEHVLDQVATEACLNAIAYEREPQMSLALLRAVINTHAIAMSSSHSPLC